MNKCPYCDGGEIEEEIIPSYYAKINKVQFIVKDARICKCNKCEGKVYSAKEYKRWEEICENRKKRAVRLAAYLWHLSKSVGKGRLKGTKNEHVEATAQAFLTDRDWPYPETTVPPKEFEDE